ncbi:DUF5683 domain-containing protein [bacterium]|nr:DUF5683 domain-containing protein [bacterium]
MGKAVLIAGLSFLIVFSSVGLTFAQDEESFVRVSVISKRDAIVLSALFPGLGQMTTGQKVKGVSFFLAEAASLVLFVNAHENYSTKKTTYDKDLKDFEAIATVGRGSYMTAEKQFKDLKDQSKDLDDLHSIRNTAIIVAAGVYAYNLVDAIFFAPSSSESRKAEGTKNRIEVTSSMVDRTPGIMLTKRF